MSNQTEFTREKGMNELNILLEKATNVLRVARETDKWASTPFVKLAGNLADKITSFKNMVYDQPDDISKSFVYYFNMKYDVLKNNVDEIYDEFERAVGNKYPVDEEVISNEIKELNILVSKTITTMDLLDCALQSKKDQLAIMKGSIDFCKKELEEIEKGSDQEIIKERIKHLSQQLIEVRKDANEIMK